MPLAKKDFTITSDLQLTLDNSNLSKAPTIVSIFSGCGGLDLGFHMEGYNTMMCYNKVVTPTPKVI